MRITIRVDLVMSVSPGERCDFGNYKSWRVEIVELDSQASPLVQVYFVAHNR